MIHNTRLKDTMLRENRTKGYGKKEKAQVSLIKDTYGKNNTLC